MKKKKELKTNISIINTINKENQNNFNYSQ